MDLIAGIWTSCLCSTICYSEHFHLAFTLCMYFTTPHMSSANQSRLHMLLLSTKLILCMLDSRMHSSFQF